MATKKSKQANTERASRDTPNLRELFEYELQKRSTYEGIAIAALGGDREALRLFAECAVVSVESATVLPDIRDWLVDALAQMQAGVEPNVAFGWKRLRRGHPPPRQDFEGLKAAFLLAQHVAGLRAEKEAAGEKKISMTKIYAVVAEAQHASVEQVRTAWEWWTGARTVLPD